MPKDIPPIANRLEALSKIVDILVSLDTQSQRRVLRGVLAFLDITLYQGDTEDAPS